jgi:hypothetical protein
MGAEMPGFEGQTTSNKNSQSPAVPPVSKRLLRFFGLLVYLVVVTGMGLELAMTAYFYHTSKSLIWVSPPGKAAQVTPEEINDKKRPRLQLHPNFGFTYRPGMKMSEVLDLAGVQSSMGYDKKPRWWDFSINNQGFLSDRDFPIARTSKKQLFVGIFGASVAASFGVEALDEITKIVHSTPGFEDKEIVLLDLAIGQTHQPNQVLVLNYILAIGQPLDLIINIDGFNEAYLGWENVDSFGTDVSMPNGWVVYGMQNEFLSRENSATRSVMAARAQMRSLEARMADAHSALHYYTLKVQWMLNRKESVTIESDIGKAKPNVDYPVYLVPHVPSDATHVNQEITDLWLRSALQMKAAADSTGAGFIELLQPNQYCGSRTFTEDEKKVVFAKDGGFPGAKRIPPIYDMMRARAHELTDHGVSFVDATAVFDKYPGPLYSDYAGHFNRRGIDIVIDDMLTAPIKQALRRLH